MSADDLPGLELARPRGRPSLYTAELAQEICRRLANGESLRSVCRSEHMPDVRTVHGWALDPEHSFFPQYERARKIGYLGVGDEILDIADDGSNDWMERETESGRISTVLNGEAVARSRLRVDTRKWMLARMLPKVFGDKVALEHRGPAGGPIPVATMGAQEAAEAYAQMLGRSG